VLGLIACTLPLVNMTRDKKQENNNWVAQSILSITACSMALGFQILYTYYKVTVEDWGALMDTMYAVAYASAALVIVTIVLNIVTIMVYRKKTVN
jgi:hypothetical protein